MDYDSIADENYDSNTVCKYLIILVFYNYITTTKIIQLYKQFQSYDAGEDESETVSETEDIFTPGPAPPVQTFFTAESDAETHTTDLVRTGEHQVNYLIKY